jgi:hypothetical protein
MDTSAEVGATDTLGRRTGPRQKHTRGEAADGGGANAQTNYRISGRWLPGLVLTTAVR